MKILEWGKRVQLDRNNKLTVVIGEQSNHNHAFMDADNVVVDEVLVERWNGVKEWTMVATILNDSQVTFSHYDVSSNKCDLTEEHANLVLNPLCPGAQYEIVRQTEVNDDNEIIQVVD